MGDWLLGCALCARELQALRVWPWYTTIGVPLVYHVWLRSAMGTKSGVPLQGKRRPRQARRTGPELGWESVAHAQDRNTDAALVQ